MSKRNTQVMQVLAGAAALAGFGYTLARRSSRAQRTARRAAAEVQPTRVPAVAPEPAAWDDGARISSAPDALDVALNLDGVFDVGPESGVEVTARFNDHVPSPLTGDDEDAPSPDDLGRAFLTHATESERSLSGDDVVPDLDGLAKASDELGEGEEDDGEGEVDDETTREYVRRHRISLMG